MGKKNKNKIHCGKIDLPMVDVLKNQKIGKPEYVDLFSNSITFNSDILDLLKDEKTSEKKRNLIISSNFDYIIDEINYRREGYLDLINIVLLNPTNAVIFMNIMKSRQIHHSMRIAINSVCYDYIAMYGQDKAQLLQMLCELANSNVLPRLFGLFPNDRDFANLLAIARYSNESIMIAMRNLNGIIITKPLDTQMIVNIYSILFDSVTDIFMGIMFDKGDTSETSSNITNACLYILDSLPTEDIKKVLYVYLQNIQLWHTLDVRCSLHSISMHEFPKIYNAVQILQQENIYLP